MDSHQLVDLVDRLALGVQTVQLHVLEGAVDLDLGLVELGRPRRLLAAERKGLQHALGLLGHHLGPLQLLLDAAAGRELPLGHDDRLTLGVVERMLGEPRAHVVDQRLVAQRD